MNGTRWLVEFIILLGQHLSLPMHLSLSFPVFVPALDSKCKVQLIFRLNYESNYSSSWALGNVGLLSPSLSDVLRKQPLTDLYLLKVIGQIVDDQKFRKILDFYDSAKNQDEEGTKDDQKAVIIEDAIKKLSQNQHETIQMESKTSM